MLCAVFKSTSHSCTLVSESVGWGSSPGTEGMCVCVLMLIGSQNCNHSKKFSASYFSSVTPKNPNVWDDDSSFEIEVWINGERMNLIRLLFCSLPPCSFVLSLFFNSYPASLHLSSLWSVYKGCRTGRVWSLRVLDAAQEQQKQTVLHVWALSFFLLFSGQVLCWGPLFISFRDDLPLLGNELNPDGPLTF